ncbi:MAG: hypothetical protein AAGA29_00270 [Planctomycetota bacterium]
MTQSASKNVLAWWPVLLGPAAIMLVLLTRDSAVGEAIRAHDGGPIPPTLTLSAGLIALIGAAVRRNELLWLLGALGLLFFLREASVPGSDDHLPGAKKGVYVGLVVIGVWAYRWRERVRPWIRAAGLFPALATMCVMYVLSQTIARGGLKFLSDVLDASGQKMRTPMEESCETVGHLLLLGAVLVGCLTRRPEADGDASDAGDSDGG